VTISADNGVAAPPDGNGPEARVQGVLLNMKLYIFRYRDMCSAEKLGSKTRQASGNEEGEGGSSQKACRCSSPNEARAFASNLEISGAAPPRLAVAATPYRAV
jgi:hypothetical protein